MLETSHSEVKRTIKQVEDNDAPSNEISENVTQNAGSRNHISGLMCEMFLKVLCQKTYNRNGEQKFMSSPGRHKGNQVFKVDIPSTGQTNYVCLRI